MNASTLFFEWRKRLNLTQDEAAAKIGIKQPSYSRYEDGTSWPRPSKLPEIEKITGIPREKLRPDIYVQRVIRRIS